MKSLQSNLAGYLHPGHAHNSSIRSDLCFSPLLPLSGNTRLSISKHFHRIMRELLLYSKRQHNQCTTAAIFCCQVAELNFLHGLSKSETFKQCTPAAFQRPHHSIPLVRFQYLVDFLGSTMNPLSVASSIFVSKNSLYVIFQKEPDISLPRPEVRLLSIVVDLFLLLYNNSKL